MATKTILFQGDSVTDAGRSRDSALPANTGLGVGYPLFIAGEALRALPGKSLAFYNRGISGNRVVDLYARWKADAINMKPDVLSILIGINDTWHEFNWQNGVEVDRYEMVYRMLLEWTAKELPKTKLVLCEPFCLQFGAVAEAWIPEMDQRRAIVRKLAKEFKAKFVPFQSALDKATTTAPGNHWLADGVHPTAAGHALLAKVWLETAGSLFGYGK